jgi:phage shock protein PspC (stress-responsive transcriptional regulator)/predicted membrane protein
MVVAMTDETPQNPEDTAETQSMGEDPKAGWERVSPPPVRKLTRSSTDKLIGGVAGGLGRYFGVDPILFRIAFVVLLFAGGVGVLAYIGLLVFVPADDGSSPLGRGNNANVAGAILLVALALVIFGPPAFFLGPVLLPVALVLGIGVLLWRAAGGSISAADPGRMAGRALIMILIGIAALGAAVGVFLLAAMGGGTMLAILAIVAGMALVIAAFAGGARWLIAPALILVLPLAIVAAADVNIDGGVGQRHYDPADMSELQSDYRLGMGELDIDMRSVELPAGQTDMHVEVGVGHAVIRVPEDACVTSDVEIGVGQANVFHRGSGGIDVAYAQSATPSYAESRPHLHLDGDVGIGAFEVVRGNDPLYFRGSRNAHPLPSCPA